MANLKGVEIEKGRIGANRLSTGDEISGFIISTPSISDLENDVPVVVYNIRDVANLGITQETDKSNTANVYRHLSEFYRLAGEGTKLHLMVVEPTESMQEIVETKVKKLLIAAGGEIKQIGVALNSTAEITMLNGLPEDIFNSIAKAQATYNWAYDNNMPCQLFLEGFNYSGQASSSQDLRNIENLSADKTTVVIGQDFLYAESLDESLRNYADVGSVLGICAKAAVEQNIGDNEQFNITDATRGIWIEPGLSSHQKNKDIYDDLQTLEDKGYVFGITYAGMAGVRINNDHVCAPIIVDADNSINEHTIAYGRVSDKAVRQLKAAYLPKVKSTWAVNEETGKMTPGTIVALEDIGDAVFADMYDRGEISYGKTTIDKNSDLLVEKVLKLSYVVVPKGSINEIKGTLNLKTNT